MEIGYKTQEIDVNFYWPYGQMPCCQLLLFVLHASFLQGALHIAQVRRKFKYFPFKILFHHQEVRTTGNLPGAWKRLKVIVNTLQAASDGLLTAVSL